VKLAIIVPVKSPRRAKNRLHTVLTEAERVSLATTMATDVFRAVASLEEFGRFVVSDDPDVLRQARDFGLEPLLDRVSQGQSAAVEQGFTIAWDRGFTAAFTIPADVPGVTPAELRTVATYRPEIEVLLVTDRERIGTNGLRLIPPHAIMLRFGEDSFNLHRAEAARANRSFDVRDIAGLQVDLDQPEDLAAFMRLGRESATFQLLKELNAAERVLAPTPPRA
jgi:2-phospho-L-lactate/phosphoenolpyruvate guanylyltransferase